MIATVGDLVLLYPWDEVDREDVLNSGLSEKTYTELASKGRKIEEVGLNHFYGIRDDCGLMFYIGDKEIKCVLTEPHKNNSVDINASLKSIIKSAYLLGCHAAEAGFDSSEKRDELFESFYKGIV